MKNLLRITMLLGSTVGLASMTSCNTEPNDVWLCGNLSDGTAGYWINGEQHTLESPGGEAVAYDMAVVNGDVYVAGTQQGQGGYWRNGKFQSLKTRVENMVGIYIKKKQK